MAFAQFHGQLCIFGVCGKLVGDGPDGLFHSLAVDNYVIQIGSGANVRSFKTLFMSS